MSQLLEFFHREEFMPIRSIYVLDTNILLSDPESLFSFSGHDVVIPIYVIEEIDKFKKESNELGLHAREVTRTLDGLRAKGSLETGVDLGNDSNLKVICSMFTLPSTIGLIKNQDEAILSVAYWIKMQEEIEHTQRPVIMVSNDLNVRVRSDALGIAAQGYNKNDIEEAVDGSVREIALSGMDIDLLYSNGFHELDTSSFNHNEYLFVKDLSGGRSTALVRVYKDEGKIKTLKKLPATVFGVRPKNREQYFLFDALLDPNISLVTVSGLAGSGKDLCSLSAGLEQVLEGKTYEKLSIAKPIVASHSDVGFLPGLLSEKLQPYMQSLYDLLEQLMGLSGGKSKAKGRSYEELIHMGVVSVEALTYIRGKTLPNQFVLISEAQNLSVKEIKTIVTRCGEGCKIVLTGDPSQCDLPKLDVLNNGLSYVKDRFKNQKVAAHVTLLKSERSILAQLAAELL